MKKLIVYDGSCPMCRLYTKGIVAADNSGCLTRISSDQHFIRTYRLGLNPWLSVGFTVLILLLMLP